MNTDIDDEQHSLACGELAISTELIPTLKEDEEEEESKSKSNNNEILLSDNNAIAIENKKKKRKMKQMISDEFHREVISVLVANHATIENPMSASLIAQKYAITFQKSFKEGMKLLRDKKEKEVWWKILKDIPGISWDSTANDDSSHIKFYLTTSPVSLEMVNNRLLTILKDCGTTLNGVRAGLIFNEYAKRYGSLVPTDLAPHSHLRAAKHIAQLPGVLTTFEQSTDGISIPTFSFVDQPVEVPVIESFDFVPGPDNDPSTFEGFGGGDDCFSAPSSPVIHGQSSSKSESSSLDPFFMSDTTPSGSTELDDMKNQFAPDIKAEVGKSEEQSINNSAILSKTSSNSMNDMVHEQKKKKKKKTTQELDRLLASFLSNKRDPALKLQLKTFVSENISSFNDQAIIGVINCADAQDDTGKRASSEQNLIDDFVDVSLLATQLQAIDDPLTSDVAFELFGSLKKFRGEHHVLVKGLVGRLSTSFASQSTKDMPHPNSTVTLPDNVQPFDMSEQWFSTTTMAEAFTRIRIFPFNTDLIALLGLIGRKVEETLHTVTKPFLKTPDLTKGSSKNRTYVYKIQDISYFSIQQFSRIIHSFRSYDFYDVDTSKTIHYINEKTNLLKCTEKPDKMVTIADLKMISKGIIKLMQDASKNGTEAKEIGEYHKKLDPLYNICNFVGHKICEIPKNTPVDEDLVVNILQSIKSHSIEDVRIRKLMASVAKYAESITQHDLRDERIVETLLQFTAVSVGKYNQVYSEVEDFLLILSKFLCLSYAKFVKSKFVLGGQDHPDPVALGQMSKNLQIRSKKYGFEASDLRYSLRNLSSSSKAVRVFTLALRPWLNFVFADFDFDNDLVLEELSLDQVTKSYSGLSKLRDDMVVENFRSIFGVGLTVLNKYEIEEVFFNFERIVSQTILIPFTRFYQNDADNEYPVEFTNLAISDDQLCKLGSLLNPRFKHSFLKMIGKSCLNWNEDDPSFNFVVNQLIVSLSVESEVDLSAVKTLKESKKRKRDVTKDNFPFSTIWGLYCELVYNLGHGKSWRLSSSQAILGIIFSKLKLLLPFVEEELFASFPENPPPEMRCIEFLKHLSMIAMGLEGTAVFNFAMAEHFFFFKQIFTTVYYDVIAYITKDTVLDALQANNNIVLGMSRIVGLDGDELPAMTAVIVKQLSLFQLVQNELDNCADAEKHRLMQDQCVMSMVKLFNTVGFLKMVSCPRVYQVGATEVFEKFSFNFEQTFDKPLLDLVKSKDSFSFFYGFSEIYRSISAFFISINFADDSQLENPFESFRISNLIQLFCEKLYFAGESFNEVGKHITSIQDMLSQPIAAMADYNRVKISLRLLKPGKETAEDEADLCQHGNRAVHVLYNMRCMMHFLAQLQQNPRCFSITQDPNYPNFVTDFGRIVGIEIFLALIDFDNLSIKSLMKLLRVSMSLLEMNASVHGLPNEDALKIARIDIIPFLLEDVFRRSVKLLESMYVSNIQRAFGSTAGLENGLSSLLSKDTMELFQECWYFVQFYYGIFPLSSPVENSSSAIKDYYRMEIESLKQIFESFYDAAYQLPHGSLVPKSHVRSRTDDVKTSSSNWQKMLEAECINSVKRQLCETNKAAWHSIIPHCVVSSFAALIRLEYSPTTILSLANMYVHASSYDKVVNGFNSTTIFHKQYGRVIIFSSALQIISRNYEPVTKEEFHHHLLIDFVNESDFSVDVVFNVITNSAKMSRGFNVIYCLLVLDLDNVTKQLESCEIDLQRTAIQELASILLQYLGLIL